MILLLGGTSEAGPIARLLCENNHEVLLSGATGQPLGGVRPDSRLHLRHGPLGTEDMVDLIRSQNILALVAATHPYAEMVRQHAAQAAARCDIPVIHYVRPESQCSSDSIEWVDSHEAAAERACHPGARLLLTIGVRHLAPYIRNAREAHCLLKIRILPNEASRVDALSVGAMDEELLAGTGPFSTEENCSVVDAYRLNGIVTKESGEAGGFPQKVEAAERIGIRLIAVRRPKLPGGCVVHTPEDVVRSVTACLR